MLGKPRREKAKAPASSKLEMRAPPVDLQICNSNGKPASPLVLLGY
jgi:hypothetical protein